MTGNATKQESSRGKSESQTQSSSSKHDEDIQLIGRNTFAVPRNVKPLGWSNRGKPQQSEVAKEQEGEIPKSNDEFRKMLLKK